MHPQYVDKDGYAIFTTLQIDYFGLPEDNGWEDKYYVVESREVISRPSYDDEFHVISNLAPIHRYCRLARFKTCLFQLTGHIGFVGKSLEKIDDIGREHVSQFNRDYLPPCMVWEYLRDILKKEKLQSFYNRIPAFAKHLGMVKNTKITTKQTSNILQDFSLMHEIFPRIRHRLARRYFPSIRAVALLLLEKYNVELSLTIPLARNARKAAEIREDFEMIWANINEELTDFYFS